MKRCSSCRCEKPESEFHRNQSRRDGLSAYCKTCNVDAQRKQYAENPESARKRYLKNPEAQKRRNYERMYGLTLERYNRMLLDQGGVCAICSQPCESRRSLSVDHNHDTGEVRGLLCCHCNRGLGSFRDRADLTDKATGYLLRFTAANQEEAT